jgi:hypothetical protein
MPFTPRLREDLLVRSHRRCCVCHEPATRDVEVHHIVPEADGGSNDAKNAIVLCLKHHAEAGHYNPRHPLGTKFSPSELRRQRDQWFAFCDSGFKHELRPSGYRGPLLEPNACRKAVGVLWSQRADIDRRVELARVTRRARSERACRELAYPSRAAADGPRQPNRDLPGSASLS